MASVTVRPVADDEVEVFLDWFERYWAEHEQFGIYPDPFARDQYRLAMQNPAGRRFWWAELDGERVGFGVFIVGPHWYRQDVKDAYIDELDVLPTARRSGVGRAVARAMLEEIHGLGVRRVELQVLPHNERAKAFWQSVGFGLESLRMALDNSASASE
jgi:ribosomal protein S18 acetylase RimI-like enzyme